LPRDGAARVIRVTAPRRTPWQVVHTSTADASYDVWLAEEPVPAEVERRAPARRTRATTRTKAKPPSALRDLDF
jgi:hypothetical protein